MAVKSKGEAGENPLVPNATLRTLYGTMLEARKLEEAIAAKARGSKLKISSIRGEEAIRASSVLQLGQEDLVSDVTAGPGMGLLLGAEPRELLKAYTSTKKNHLPAISRLLAPISEPLRRLEVALGAAYALKAQQKQGVVVAFIPRLDLSDAQYRRILRPAASNELPLILVVLPSSKTGGSHALISKVSGKAGVPGIPVDASDSVALYRVVQESLGRTRGGDGPVLIECVRWKPVGGKVSAATQDPITYLAHFLLGKKIVSEKWLIQADRIAGKRLSPR
ncbi:MAG: thiamine pyrophosphate-dependent enzyme [Edaphobacter sp.]|uniref:thiamine pyrophosphate-dependent enzyme n=1 Tax=Edaphobacter sp. TaxID=1934404 RepID=UPI0023A05CE3|nr:thiamine pyrophosphate-dependent enzyme [Edaphobacter sp.]MDE1175547.1 thiamine pyrophosphate-dependent enzyme [Edaphobacter sp.]